MKILELDNRNSKNIKFKKHLIFKLYSKFNNWKGKIENV